LLLHEPGWQRKGVDFDAARRQLLKGVRASGHDVPLTERFTVKEHSAQRPASHQAEEQMLIFPGLPRILISDRGLAVWNHQLAMLPVA